MTAACGVGGLTFATFVTLLLVPVLYAAVVLDLKLVKWEETSDAPGHTLIGSSGRH